MNDELDALFYRLLSVLALSAFSVMVLRLLWEVLP